MANENVDRTEKNQSCHPNFWFPAFLLSSFGFILSYFALAPGLMSYDSIYMYQQGISLQFTDWHHPFLPILMFVSRFFSGDTSLLLFFQSGCMWIGIYFFTVSIRTQIGLWALLCSLLGYTPIILDQIGFLGKTPLQTSMFFVVFSYCYYFYVINKRPGLLTLVMLLLALFLGTTIRGYTYISVIPVVSFLAYISLFRNHTKGVLVKCMLSAIFILIAFSIVEKTTLYKILQVEKTYKPGAALEYDLAGIMAKSNKLYATRLLLPEFRDTVAIKKYCEKLNCKWQIVEIFGKDSDNVGHVYQNIFTDEDFNYLVREWFSAILENPLTYLKHRKQAILFSFGVNSKVKGLRDKITFKHTSKNKKMIFTHTRKRASDSITWGLLKKYCLGFQKTFLSKPWFWLVLNFLIFIYSALLLCKKSLSQPLLPLFVLNFSGTLFYMTYFIVCLSPDTRYTYWGTIASAFSLLGVLGINIKNIVYYKSSNPAPELANLN